ncbi:hypothetical protein JDV02_009562 [Purpureocillium takamizusanense]|uniref:Uncharacterized protein n=1 Tax=Purpureocillium takamizusanense TaxID=2060973 RepID=A0A9Q8QQ77_9HYPO|nr:uncharacterized protein JDV02_009562 [Purpureocillium takamizusanense]UNI23760.1 hypothetical protein JDV02_009562 [Purpureocillium takamizusanense]
MLMVVARLEAEMRPPARPPRPTTILAADRDGGGGKGDHIQGAMVRGAGSAAGRTRSKTRLDRHATDDRRIDDLSINSHEGTRFHVLFLPVHPQPSSPWSPSTSLRFSRSSQLTIVDRAYI